MSAPLVDALLQLNLAPGETRHIAVNGYDVEVRRVPPKEEVSDYADQVMFQPWVSFPRTSAGTVLATPGPVPLPSPPDIPAEEEETGA